MTQGAPSALAEILVRRAAAVARQIFWWVRIREYSRGPSADNHCMFYFGTSFADAGTADINGIAFPGTTP